VSFEPDYPHSNIEISVPLEDLPSRTNGEAVNLVIDEEYFSVPSDYIPEKGVNSGSMELGYTGDDWVLTKPANSNYGRSGPAHIATGIVCDAAELPCPTIGYDQSSDRIVMEHMGSIRRPRTVDPQELHGIEESILTKVIASDNDIRGNIGYTGEEWIAYDFDRAGQPIGSRVEGSLVDTLNDIEYLDLTVEEIESKASKVARELDLEDIEEIIDNALSNLPEYEGHNSLDLDTYIHNLRCLQDRNAFTGEVEETVHSFNTDEEDDSTGNDLFKQELQESFLN
jgi:hypothetical protein